MNKKDVPLRCAHILFIRTFPYTLLFYEYIIKLNVKKREKGWGFDNSSFALNIYRNKYHMVIQTESPFYQSSKYWFNFQLVMIKNLQNSKTKKGN